jgi:hypothetical protein
MTNGMLAFATVYQGEGEKALEAPLTPFLISQSSR